MLAAALNLPFAAARVSDPAVKSHVDGGLEWLASQQHKLGHWTAQGRYPTAMTALAGMAMLAER